MNASSTLCEGWALYGEELVLEQGFLARPEHRLLVLRDRLWRALRVTIDVDLQLGAVSAEETGERVAAELGFTPAQARGGVAWYGRAPTVPMSYAVGWAAIRALRCTLGGDAADAPALRAFHDRLLAPGSMALVLAVRRAFGDTAWERAAAVAFGDAPAA